MAGSVNTFAKLDTLGGWHRLWVLVSGLSLIVVVVVAWREFPRRSDIPHGPAIYAAMPGEHTTLLQAELVERRGVVDTQRDIAQRIIDEYREADEAEESDEPVLSELIWGVALPNAHTLYFAENKPEDLMWQVANDYLAVVDARLSPLRRRFLLMLSVCWLGGCLGLYALGWSIGWVVRGFRRR